MTSTNLTIQYLQYALFWPREGADCDASMTNASEKNNAMKHTDTFAFRVSGFGFRVCGLGFRVEDSGFAVWDLGLRIQGLGFGV